MRTVDVSVVMTAHRERTVVHRAMRSIDRAAAAVAALGATVERVAVLDRADAQTAAAVRTSGGSRWKVIETDLGDPGLARNAGVGASTGRLVAFLDGDDLMSASWLMRACSHYEAFPEPRTVLHPSTVVAFGDEVVLAQHYSSTTTDFDPFELGERNLWRTGVVAPRAVVEAVPFVEPPAFNGFHEDWHWSCEVLANGGTFVVLPETCGYYRRRAGSLMGMRPRGLFATTSLFRSAPDPDPRRSTRRDGRTNVAQTGASRPNARERLEIKGRSLALRHAWVQPAARVVRSGLRRLDARRVESAIPAWLRNDLTSIHAVEPALFADTQIAGALRYTARGDANFACALRTLLANTPAGTSHVLVVPWLKRGGADLEVLNYARALVELGHSVIVVATEDTNSPWASRLPPEVPFVDFHHISGAMNSDIKRQLLAVYLIQASCETVHSLNSRLFFEVLETYGEAVSASCSVFLSVFCEDIAPSGQRTGYVTREVPAVEHWATGILADNRRVLTWLHEIIGIETDRLIVHYQPQPCPDADVRRPRRDVLSVVWAGRLDRQKRPDVLIDVIRACAELPIHFSVYGYGLLDAVAAPSDFDYPNATFRGSYDGFESLPVADFDVYLHTAQWEGLPNVLFEATTAGLPIVTSDAGGIPELVTDGVSGRVVSPFDDVEGYVSALEALIEHPDTRRHLVEGARENLRRRHSWDGFCDALARTGGYLAPPRGAGA